MPYSLHIISLITFNQIIMWMGREGGSDVNKSYAANT